jgi:hypothetical protein
MACAKSMATVTAVATCGNMYPGAKNNIFSWRTNRSVSILQVIDYDWAEAEQWSLTVTSEDTTRMALQ